MVQIKDIEEICRVQDHPLNSQCRSEYPVELEFLNTPDEANLNRSKLLSQLIGHDYETRRYVG